LRSPVILRIFKGTQLVEVKQFENDQIIFGNGGDVQVQLADPGVSPIHCLIELRDSGYYIADLGSSSGTNKNGAPVLDEALSSGDQIAVGPFVIHFFVGVPKPKAPPAGAPSAPTPAEPPSAPPVRATPKVAPPPTAPVAAAPEAPPPKPKPATPAQPPQAPTPQAPAPKVPQQTSRPKLSEAKSVGASSGSESENRKEVRSAKKQRRTFAPPSQITDLRTYLRPTKGPVLEVIVAWRERIISTHHFTNNKSISLGSHVGADIEIPPGFVPDKFIFADLSSGTQVNLTSSMVPEIFQSDKSYDADMMVSLGKSSRNSNGGTVRVEQGDLLAISVADGMIQIFVRHIPATAVPALAGIDFSAGELTGIVVSLVIVALLALYMSVYSQNDQEEQKQEDQLRLAQFVYNKKEIPKEIPVPKEVKPVETPPPPVPPPKQKIEVTEKPKETKGDPQRPSATKNQPARAEEVRAKSTKSKQKVFTSAIKQGGAVKTTDKAGANAQSKRDVNKEGLLSAFGSGGNRTKLDQSYSGSGDLIGTASAASGSSGFTKDRAGDDLGSQFKDTGAGGNGTATQGIAGIKTQGRSSGQLSYGNVGVGGKGSVAIEVGGSGAEFVGTVDKEAVRRVVKSIYNQIKNCYDRGLRGNSELEGKVVIHWEVYDQGHVKTSVVKESPDELRSVAECVALRIKDQRFPEPPTGSYYEVDYPFMMGKQN
jgi:pSer/pThr/pTyr-binding forkhead associated (FHA) protein